MNSIVNNMPKYDHRQYVLSDWLAELDQRFQLGEVGEDKHKITWCQLLIGATGSSILSGLEDDAKETLLSRLGIGSAKDEAWAALKNLKKGSKEIVELAGEAEKLVKRLHPRDEEVAECHAIGAFLGALERPLAAEVQKLGFRTLEDVVAAARRTEKVLEEQADSKMERLISAMQDQIRILKKDLKEAHDQITTHQASATPTAALAASPAATVAAAHPPPLAQQPPLATAHRLLPLPLATSTRTTKRNVHTFDHLACSKTGDLLAAFYAEKKGTLCPNTRLVQSYSAYCASKLAIPLAALQEDKSWSCLQQRMATKTPLRRI